MDGGGEMGQVGVAGRVSVSRARAPFAGTAEGLGWAAGQAYEEPVVSAPALWTHLDNRMENLWQMGLPF